MKTKSLIIASFFVFISVYSFAQTRYSVSFDELRSKHQQGFDISEKHQTFTENNIRFVSVIAQIDSHFSEQILAENNIILRSKVGDIVTLFVPEELVLQKQTIPGILYIEKPRKISQNLHKVVKDARIDSVHQGINLPSGFSGKDVIIGITDWGFDYTHPMFYDTLLQHSRILKAWDQFKESGPAPQGFTYGTEFVGESELLAAQCDTMNIYDLATHGSHVAGIAGGSGAGTKYRGVAYDANFMFATFLIDEAAVLDAFSWMKENAEIYQKRLVVNMSWGLYWFGTLDGNSLLSRAIDTMSSQGVVFVTSGGNNGDEDLHLKKVFSNMQDTLKTVVGFDMYSYYSKMWGQAITMWGEEGVDFQIEIHVADNSYQTLAQSVPIRTSDLNGFFEDFLIVNQDTVFYNYILESENPLNQRPHIHLRISNRNSSNKIVLKANAHSGTLHMWNVIELTTGVGNWGSPFLSPNSEYTAGDSYYSIGEPASARSVISVAAHSNEAFLPNGTMVGGYIAPFSSKGPTLDERVKPDISAPGVGVVSSISSFTTQSFSSIDIVESVSFGGRNYPFVKFSGTSMSGPVVAGVVALMLEANPTLSSQQIKQILLEIAREDIRTGTIPENGSTQWGFGKLSAYSAIKKALETQQVSYYQKNDACMIFPNPANSYFSLIYDLNFKPSEIIIYDTMGKMCYSSVYISDNVDVGFLKEGFYFVCIQSENNQISVQKLVKKK
ncbi:MAG: S8 family peptidase [Bacteroidales bacterium]|nr:S8 family peptidase [Bacteroidales bacterium]